MADAVIIFIAQYLYLFVLLLGAVFFFREPRGEWKQLIVCGAVVAALAFIASRVAAFFYYDPRPFVVGRFTPLFPHAADNGFPSDHALLTGAIATVVYLFNKKWSIAFWALAFLIGWARVASGVHHTTDIAGSFAIAIASGAVYYFFIGRKRTPELAR